MEHALDRRTSHYCWQSAKINLTDGYMTGNTPTNATTNKWLDVLLTSAYMWLGHVSTILSLLTDCLVYELTHSSNWPMSHSSVANEGFGLWFDWTHKYVSLHGLCEKQNTADFFEHNSACRNGSTSSSVIMEISTVSFNLCTITIESQASFCAHRRLSRRLGNCRLSLKWYPWRGQHGTSHPSNKGTASLNGLDFLQYWHLLLPKQMDLFTGSPDDCMIHHGWWMQIHKCGRAWNPSYREGYSNT